MAAKKRVLVKEEKWLNWKLPLLVVVSFAAYYPVLTHEFVNWDDIVYIMNNDMITAFNWINLKKIFSSYFMGNYHPFILLSFLFDFHFFRFAAPGYHLHNLLLHIADTLLVYSLFFKLLKKNSNMAVTVALLFALHPMHVESVAWVSERKDVLYTAYYLLSLIAWLFYLEKKKTGYFLLAILFFIFSCLSKAQAVTLPVVLILFDIFLARKFSMKLILEKVPFFLISLIFGIVAVFAQKASHYINPLGIPVAQSLFYAPWSLCIYLFKFLLPIGQTGVYEYPVAASGGPPLYVYFSPLVFLFLALAIWKYQKSYPVVTFGLLFFLVTILPVLQFLPVGGAVAAERYTYIPYIGLCFMAAFFFWEYRTKAIPKTRTLFDTGGIFILILLAILTWNRAQVWKDSIALWTDVLEKNPSSIQAYTNRAFIYNEKKEYDKAIRDLTDGLKLDTNDSKNLNFYGSRAFIYKKTGKYDSALYDYSAAIRKNPGNLKPYFDRGILYTDRFGKYDLGIHDFKIFLQKFPEDIDGNFKDRKSTRLNSSH